MLATRIRRWGYPAHPSMAGAVSSLVPFIVAVAIRADVNPGHPIMMDKPPVTLQRASLNIPMEPHRDEDGHPALGSGGAIAAGKAPKFERADPSLVASQEQSGPQSGFFGVLKAAGIPRETIAGTIKWAENGTAKTDAELAEIDARDMQRAREELQLAWGDQFDANLQAVNRYVDGMGEARAEVIRSARDPETGSAFANDPTNLARLAGIARAPQPQSYTIEGIEAFMRSNRAAYNKDEALQARYREMLVARERQKGS